MPWMNDFFFCPGRKFFVQGHKRSLPIERIHHTQIHFFVESDEKHLFSQIV